MWLLEIRRRTNENNTHGDSFSSCSLQDRYALWEARASQL